MHISGREEDMGGLSSPFTSKNSTRWALWSAWVSLSGVGLSAYMVYDKYRPAGRSSCDLSERISCSVINNSVFASLFGVPIAIYGIVWFLVIGFLAYRLHKWHDSPPPSSSSSTKMSEPVALATAMVAWCVTGAGFIVYLLAAEFILGAICPMCTLVHILVGFLLFASLRLYARHLYLPATSSIATLQTFFSTSTTPPAIASARALRPLLPSLAILAALPLVAFILASVLLPALHPSHVALRTCVLAQRQQLVLYGSDRCAVCLRQKEHLGPDMMQMIKYVDCVSKPAACEGKDVRGYPTWVLEDWAGSEVARHYGFRTIDQLLTLASCKSDE